ncbi:hypothetical protein J3R82DRAFT_8232 [Butyriboletus roseoflavus]|nr:hypothetical protein J3R82DRAFT_8232 [Butyriboletus roseoflavus]
MSIARHFSTSPSDPMLFLSFIRNAYHQNLPVSLKHLFAVLGTCPSAKDFFPDVVWKLHPDDHNFAQEGWGHDVIPPSFQARYFLLCLPPITVSDTPSPAPALSSVLPSLTLNYAHNPYSPSPCRSSFPTTDQIGVLRLCNKYPSSFIFDELEYLDQGDTLNTSLIPPYHATASAQRVASTSPTKIRFIPDSRAHNRDFLFSLFHSRLLFPVLLTQLPNSGYEATILAGLSAPAELLTVTLPSPPFTTSPHFTIAFCHFSIGELSLTPPVLRFKLRDIVPPPLKFPTPRMGLVLVRVITNLSSKPFPVNDSPPCAASSHGLLSPYPTFSMSKSSVPSLFLPLSLSFSLPFVSSNDTASFAHPPSHTL